MCRWYRYKSELIGQKHNEINDFEEKIGEKYVPIIFIL
jgi:hypothetical protein